MLSIPLITQSPNAVNISKQWNIENRPALKTDVYVLEFIDQKLTLRNIQKVRQDPLVVDFLSGSLYYRYKKGGGRSQDLAKAIGLKKAANPSVVDLTAGLGRDAFILASLGSHVHMFERHSVIAALLNDGLNRAYQNPLLGQWVDERLSMSFGDSRLILKKDLPFMPDVVYLDPMFTSKKKSALVKKEMRIFHDILGNDEDSGALFDQALTLAKKRVVVKRFRQAPPISSLKPDTALIGKSNRFDVYLLEK